MIIVIIVIVIVIRLHYVGLLASLIFAFAFFCLLFFEVNVVYSPCRNLVNGIWCKSLIWPSRASFLQPLQNYSPTPLHLCPEASKIHHVGCFVVSFRVACVVISIIPKADVAIFDFIFSSSCPGQIGKSEVTPPPVTSLAHTHTHTVSEICNGQQRIISDNDRSAWQGKHGFEWGYV